MATMNVGNKSYGFDVNEVLTRFLKYALEGVIVALAAYTIPSMSLEWHETTSIALVAMCTFSILDFFVPSMSDYARMGAGAGIGANLVGFPGNGGQRRH